MDKQAPVITLKMQVRDYELDLQGIVNNSVYMNYLEHARHEYLRECGLDFSVLHTEGYDPVVVRAEIDYKKALRSGNRFIVTTDAVREGRLKIVFRQKIELEESGTLMAEARIIAACLFKGRPVEPLRILQHMGLTD